MFTQTPGTYYLKQALKVTYPHTGHTIFPPVPHCVQSCFVSVSGGQWWTPPRAHCPHPQLRWSPTGQSWSTVPLDKPPVTDTTGRQCVPQ